MPRAEKPVSLSEFHAANAAKEYAEYIKTGNYPVDHLNPNELAILAACNKQANEETGGEFGNMPDVDRGGLSKHEFAGYVSSLKAKGIFTYITNEIKGELSHYNGQFTVNEEYRFYGIS